MKRGIKIVILSIVLLTPAAIYIFLQAFGHNEFELPFYSEEGKFEEPLLSSNSDLNPATFSFEGFRDYDGLKVDKGSFEGNIIVIEFVSAQTDHTERDFQIKRISGVFRDEGSVRIVRVIVNNNHSVSKRLNTAENKETNITVLYTDMSELNKMVQFKMSSGEDAEKETTYDNMLLLDKRQRIRGAYSADDFEEVDRLILEVKILLKQEQHA